MLEITQYNDKITVSKILGARVLCNFGFKLPALARHNCSSFEQSVSLTAPYTVQDGCFCAVTAVRTQLLSLRKNLELQSRPRNDCIQKLIRQKD